VSVASYLRFTASERAERLAAARALLAPCRVCPRECGVDRPADERGYCRIGALAEVASANLHFGEEPPISAAGGSGTVFFTGCNLRCDFCQNYPISQLGVGNAMTADRIAEKMVGLQRRGAVNINFVTPTHVVPQMLAAVFRAAEMGLSVPIAYNCNGYERLETVRLLEGVVDIFMPDFKYADEGPARELSDAPGYPRIAEDAIAEMFRQVGPLTVDERGVAVRGVVVRHLVLPDGLAGTWEVMRRLAARIGTDLDISLMTQYFPAHRASMCARIARKITDDEIDEALSGFESSGIERCFFQGYGQD
jgi:putative pyruvate formate lyase activating enzyme